MGREHAQVKVFFQLFCCSISGEHSLKKEDI